jgi:uncharacterized protein
MRQSVKKIKIVADTNILVSFFVYPGATLSELKGKIETGRYELGVSEEIIAEFRHAMINNIKTTVERTNLAEAFIRSNAFLICPKIKLNIVSDPTDNKIVECALEFKADYIVSGDKHILVLGKYKDIKIIKAADLIKLD